MANWQRTLPLKDIWPTRDPHQIAAAIADRLPKLRPLGDAHLDQTRDHLAEEFKSIAGDPSADAEDFDGAMAQLYDWADTKLDANWNGKKVCWVQTF